MPTQVRAQSIATNNEEITIFLLIQTMGVLHFRSYKDYWAVGSRIPDVLNCEGVLYFSTIINRLLRIRKTRI